MKKRKNQILFQTVNDNGVKTNITIDCEQVKKSIANVKADKEQMITLRITAEDGTQKDVPIKMADLRQVIKKAELLTAYVPKFISYYLTDMTFEYAKLNKVKLVGRDHEIEKIWFYLSQKKRNNVFLVGLPDVGKTAICKEIIRQISVNECPKEFYEKRVIRLNASRLQKIQNKKKFAFFFYEVTKFILKNKDEIILYIEDSFDMLTNVSLVEFFYSLIQKYNIPILTTSLEENMEEYFIDSDYISKYLNIVYIDEPNPDEIYPMIKYFIKRKEKEYGVKAPKEIVEFGIYSCFLSDTLAAIPGDIINIFEKSFLEAKRKDKEVLDKASILSCYNSDMKRYNKYPEKSKRITAYHETGHYIAAVKSKYMKNMKIAFVSNLPMRTWDGVTQAYHVDSEEEIRDKEFYIESIIFCLAGRVSEMIISKESTFGAYSDIQSANETARAMILELGFSEVFLNRGYDTEDLYLFSEKKKEEIDKEIQKIIDEAYKRTVELIDENKELISIIAEKLLEEEIISGKRLGQICKEYEESKKVPKSEDQNVAENVSEVKE